MSRATSRTASARSTLNAISGRTAPTIVPPADSWSPQGRSRAATPPDSDRRRAPPSRPAKERRAAAGNELAVQEERAAQLPADALGAAASRGARAVEIGGLDRNDRTTPPRRCADERPVTAQVDPLARDRHRRPRARRRSPVVADEREDRAVVVRLDVDVEQLRVPVERGADRVNRPRSRPSEKFGTASKGHRHGPYSRSREGVLRRARHRVRRVVRRDGSLRERDRPDWDEEIAALVATIERPAGGSTLDVACGTGFLTRHLRGEARPASTRVTRCSRSPRARAPRRDRPGDAIPLPFGDRAFERLFTGHFYGHLKEPERVALLARPDGSRTTRRRRLLGGALARRGRMAAASPQRRLHDGRSTSASSPARAWRRDWATARCCTKGSGSWSCARPRDATALVVSLLRLAPARPPRVPRLRRGRLPAGVVARDRASIRSARVHVRTGSGRRRGRRAPAPGAGARAGRYGAGSRSSTRRRSTPPSTARP